MATQTTDKTFKDDVINSDIPVLVDFWAPWCGPCQVLGPVMDNLSETVKNKAKVFKLNVDENPETSAAYGIRSIPTVLVFKNGTLSEQLVGVQPITKYIDALGVD